MLSDEHYEQARENIGGTLTRYGFDLDEWPTWRIDEFCDELVRDVLPDVAPLGPGEMIVTQTPHLRLTVTDGSEPGWLEISTDGMATRPASVMEIDAAGVAALREACRRWLAAQEGDHE